MKVLSKDEALSVFRNHRLGRLGCIVEGEPYVLPINYVFDDDAIYCHSAMGLKIQALRRNPRACLQVDDIKTDFEWRSAIAFGSYEEIEDQGQRTRIMKKLLARFPLLTPVEAQIASARETEVIVFRLKIQRVTGVSEE